MHARARFRLLLIPAALLVVSVPHALSPPPAAAADTASPACTARTAPIPQGAATLVSQAVIPGHAGRLIDITLSSPALAAQTHVNVLLPAGFDATGRTRYPTLYLIHGAAGTYQDWITVGNAQQIVDQASTAPFITIMPDAGTWGFYTDWYGSDLDGTPSPPPAWTTYHITELIPWIDSHFPTAANRNHRAIAGLSMGGFGAISYAARFPSLFASAGTFSGAVDNDFDYPYANSYLSGLAPAFSGGHLDQCVWGDEVTQDVHWRGANPTYLAESLAYTDLFIASGGGTTPTTLANDPIEQTCYFMSQSLIAQLDRYGIKHTDDFYGGGSHAWQYWQADLVKYLPLMAQSFAKPPASPPPGWFSYRSILPAFSVWDWSFTTNHQVTEFTYLTGVSRNGLTALGSGTLSVTTARLYAPGSTWAVTQGSVTQLVSADRSGRLAFVINLGPPHPSEQTGFNTNNETAGWNQATVSIQRAHRGSTVVTAI